MPRPSSGPTSSSRGGARAGGGGALALASRALRAGGGRPCGGSRVSARMVWLVHSAAGARLRPAVPLPVPLHPSPSLSRGPVGRSARRLPGVRGPGVLVRVGMRLPAHQRGRPWLLPQPRGRFLLALQRAAGLGSAVRAAAVGSGVLGSLGLESGSRGARPSAGLLRGASSSRDPWCALEQTHLRSHSGCAGPKSLHFRERETCQPPGMFLFAGCILGASWTAYRRGDSAEGMLVVCSSVFLAALPAQSSGNIKA
nr:uncharacterized protein LOC108400488 [Manis javanica]